MTGWLLALLAAGALAVGTAPAHAALAPEERVMVSTVEREFERSVLLLERLVNQNSGTFNSEGVAQVGAMMRAELDALGFTTRWIPLPEAGRAGHLVAVHSGKPGRKRLLLIAHLDTVFEKDSPFQTFRRDGDLATGPGAGDNKGGLVVMLAALRAMQAAGTLSDANIELFLSGDEEQPGSPLQTVRADLVAAGKRADVALDFEFLAQEGNRDMGSIARRSYVRWEIRATGRAGHSAQIFNPIFGHGAIYELSRIVSAFHAEIPEPDLTISVGLMSGGSTLLVDPAAGRATAGGKPNVMPAEAFAHGDLRALSDEQAQRARSRMEAIVARHLPGTAATLTFSEGSPAMAPTEGNRALLRRLNEINRDLGLPEMPELDPARRGAGDIVFVARDVDGLVGLGTASRGDHTPQETVSLVSIRRQAIRAAILMSRLASLPQAEPE